jgi:hypothetical protein
MLRTLIVTIPAEDVTAARELLITLRAVKAESAARLAPDRSDDVEAVEELLQLTAARDDPTASLELSGPPGLIRDVAYGLLLDGVDALAEACRAYEDGRSSLADLTGAGESAARRVALMKRVEESDCWSAD